MNVGSPKQSDCLRRHFRLPMGDEEFLDSLGICWESVIESNVRRVVIYSVPLPPGYNHQATDRFYRIESGYPDTQLDMAYFYPHLARVDGKLIGALSHDSFDGKQWQRWSRHRTPQSVWRPGVDDLATHHAFVEEFLQAEFLKR